MSIPVLFVPFRGPLVAHGTVPLKRKREGIWNNTGRNRLLAELAVEVSLKPRKLLRGHGADPKAVHWADRVRQRVALLVEGVEHAERLHRLLPGWELRHAVPSDREPDDAEEEFDAPLPRGTIATLVSAARYGLRCDVLVRGTGHTGRLDWDRVTGVGGKGTEPALVIDVMDLSDARSRADSEVREQEYRHQGLRVLQREGKTQNT